MLVHLLAAHRFVEINQMAVEVRTVDTGELGFAADRDAAAAAHAGAVDHDRVHADDGLDPELLGQLADKLHHDQRSDRDHQVILVAVLNQLLQLVGDEALVAVRPINRSRGTAGWTPLSFPFPG